jgi:hypothetical protein
METFKRVVKITDGPLSKSGGPRLILVWSVLIASIATWLALPGDARKKPSAPPRKVVLAMDTAVRSHIYDRSNADRGITNADAVVSLLSNVNGLSVSKETTSLEWNREAQVGP